MKGNEKMTKNEMIKKIQEAVEIEIPMKDIDAILKAQEQVVREAVLANDEVTIPGIGKVKTKVVPEKTGTVMMGANKGSQWVKPEHKEATIKIASSLKKIFE